MTGRRDEIHELEIVRPKEGEHWLLRYGVIRLTICGKYYWDAQRGQVPFRNPTEDEIRRTFQEILELHNQAHERDEMIERVMAHLRDELRPKPPPEEEVMEEGALKRAIRELNIMDTVGGESDS